MFQTTNQYWYNVPIKYLTRMIYHDCFPKKGPSCRTLKSPAFTIASSPSCGSDLNIDVQDAWRSTYLSIYISIYLSIYAFINVYVYIYISIHTYMCIYIYISSASAYVHVTDLSDIRVWVRKRQWWPGLESWETPTMIWVSGINRDDKGSIGTIHQDHQDVSWATISPTTGTLGPYILIICHNSGWNVYMYIYIEIYSYVWPKRTFPLQQMTRWSEGESATQRLVGPMGSKWIATIYHN